MQKKLPVSVCLISGAEASRIGRALASVASWAEEIVVVLNAEVADDTEAIATRHGARVYREPWKGHVAQKNSAAAKATQPWVLGLDADEAVTPGLVAEFASLFADPARLERCAAYSFPRLTSFCGRWIRHGDWYPDRQTRLWRRGSARWGGIDPHDKLEVEGRVGRLRSDLLHYTAESIDRQLVKVSQYSDYFVAQALASGREPSLFDLAIRPFWRFVRAYVVRLGFLDGWPGYYIAANTAFYTVTRYVKILEARQRSQPPAAPAG